MRRSFLKRLSALAAFWPLPGFPRAFKGGRQPRGAGLFLPNEALLQRFIQGNDDAVTRLLQKQETLPEHPRYGALPNRDGLYPAMVTAGFVQYLTCAYVSPNSKFYRQAAIRQAMEAAVSSLLGMQHPDGTIDLPTTNFHSTPDTGFVVEPLSLAFKVLRSLDDQTLAPLLANLAMFLQRSGEALAGGGIHTPNHRWVVSMALARLYDLFPREQYRLRIGQWLKEGIDIDPDGQYYEKSTHIYSPLTNRCLITVARLMDRPELFEPVRRNLEMTPYYVHPNGELVTEASRRQDQYRVGPPDPYFYPYYYMAILDQNGSFAAMVDLILQAAPFCQLQHTLIYFLADPFLRQELPPPAPLPLNYNKLFPHSKLARIRRGETDATLLAENAVFFTFSKGPAVLQGVRLATAFFGKGQFESEMLERQEGRYLLCQDLDGPYYQPFPETVSEIVGDEKWEEEREKRPKSETQYLHTSVTIEEKDARFHLHFEIRGTEGVPLAIELGFRPGGQLNGVRRLSEEDPIYLLEEGEGIYRFEDRHITFGPGPGAPHRWTQLRGARPRMDALSVYITGLTPFKYTLSIY